MQRKRADRRVNAINKLYNIEWNRESVNLFNDHVSRIEQEVNELAKLTNYSDGYVQDIRTTLLPRLKLKYSRTFNYKRLTYEQFLCLTGTTHNESQQRAFKEFVYLHHKNFRSLQHKYEDWAFIDGFFVPRTDDSLRNFYNTMVDIKREIYADVDSEIISSGDSGGGNYDNKHSYDRARHTKESTCNETDDNSEEYEDSIKVENSTDTKTDDYPVKSSRWKPQSSNRTFESTTTTANNFCSPNLGGYQKFDHQNYRPYVRDRFFNKNDNRILAGAYEEICLHKLDEILSIDHTNIDLVDKLHTEENGKKIKNWLKLLHPDKSRLGNLAASSLLFQKVLYLQRL